ncbi:hypothetical protein [Pedobacter sp. Leaf250]|uniref:hypothetical protein n=1 Tax=Pedobacter sp. Leaf250 TaxID=2876559 RepID=UPI001E426FA1|nr:hypothetical protein [Pedobacter sp. Leaf250]
MKNIYIFAILILSFIHRADAQENIATIDGNKYVKQLADQRYQFNKSLIKRSRIQLPEAKSIFASGSTLVFDGHAYVLKNNEVVEIKGFLLSKTTLSAITNKLLMLDAFQKSCAEDVNSTYNKSTRDLQYVKNKDRQYFSALKQILSLTASISDQYQKPNASVTIEMAMNKIETPTGDSKDNGLQTIALAKIQ